MPVSFCVLVCCGPTRFQPVPLVNVSVCPEVTDAGVLIRILLELSTCVTVTPFASRIDGDVITSPICTVSVESNETI